jgi:hypothetical protein
MTHTTVQALSDAEHAGEKIFEMDPTIVSGAGEIGLDIRFRSRSHSCS